MSTEDASSNRTLYLVYNQISTLSLEPCAALMAANKSGSASSCAAAAFDKTSGSDLCAFISVQDVSTIPYQTRCVILHEYVTEQLLAISSPAILNSLCSGAPLCR